MDAALTEQLRAVMPYAGTLGLELLAASTDEVRGQIVWEERLTTAGGLMHGGVLMGLADAVGAYCAFLNLPDGSTTTATIESKTNFFARRAVGPGRSALASASPRQPDDRGRDGPLRRRRQARRARHPDAGRALTMRRLPPLLAVLLASACGGDDESATETVTVTTATTVTITETTTDRLPRHRHDNDRRHAWAGLQEPLPEDGTLPVDDFNAYAESVDDPWERDLAGVTNEFLGDAASDAQNRSFQATSAGEGSSATASLLLDGLLDDSVRSRRYDLTLSRRQDGTWRIDTAQWSQRCQQGRGHQNFSPELCVC